MMDISNLFHKNRKAFNLLLNSLPNQCHRSYLYIYLKFKYNTSDFTSEHDYYVTKIMFPIFNFYD